MADSVTCDTVGLFARTVDDLVLLTVAFRLRDDVPPPQAPLDLRTAKFGLVRTHVWPKAQPSVVAAVDKAKALLVAAGAKVEDVDLPADFSSLVTWHRDIMHMEGGSAFLGDFIRSSDALDPWIAKHVTNPTDTTRRAQLDACDNIARLRPIIDNITSNYTALIAPSATDEAPVLEEPLRFTGDSSFNSMWTVLHTPVINVPGFVGPNGMPIGLSLIGPRYHEQSLLRTAREVGVVFEAGGWILDRK